MKPPAPNPSDQMIEPVAYVFFALATANLVIGTTSYFKIQRGYANRELFVKESWSLRILVLIIGASIIAACFVLASGMS